MCPADTVAQVIQCPGTAVLHQAAARDFSQLTNDQQQHLLNPDGCETCKAELLQIMRRSGVDPNNIQLITRAPASCSPNSAYSSALLEHSPMCDGSISMCYCKEPAAALRAAHKLN